MKYTFTKTISKRKQLTGDKLVLIDFYSDWCGPCKVMSPVVDRMAEKNWGVGVTSESVLEKKIQKML